MEHNTVRLPFATPRDIEAAAAFVQSLRYNGAKFTAQTCGFGAAATLIVTIL